MLLSTILFGYGSGFGLEDAKFMSFLHWAAQQKEKHDGELPEP